MSLTREGESGEPIFDETYRAGFQQLADGLFSVRKALVEKFKSRADLLPQKFRDSYLLDSEIDPDAAFLSECFGNAGNFQFFYLRKSFSSEIKKEALAQAASAPEEFIEDQLRVKAPSIEKTQVENVEKIREGILQIEEVFLDKLKAKLEPIFSAQKNLKDDPRAQSILTKEFAVLKNGLRLLQLEGMLDVDERSKDSIFERLDEHFHYAK